MKALVLKGKKDISYEEIEMKKCPKDGLLLKIEAVGLCGSDIRTYEFGHHNLTYPAILGHENAGEIIQVGVDAPGEFKVGDRIIMFPTIPCMKCWYCQNGKHSLCINRPTYGTDLHGGMAEYMVIPKEGIERGTICKIPKDIKGEDIVVVELLSSILNAQEYANVSLGETVVIIGSGPIGCLHTEVARLRGAKEIIIVDIKDNRLQKAKDFSATHFINSAKENLKERIMEITSGFGADVVIIAAPSASAIKEGLELLRKQGRLVIFGGLNKEDPWVTLDGNLIHYNELKVIGTFGYNGSTFEKAFNIVCNKMLRGNIVTHILPLEQMEEGVRLVKEGEALKVVLKP